MGTTVLTSSSGESSKASKWAYDVKKHTFRQPDLEDFKLPPLYQLSAMLSPEKSYLFHSARHKDVEALCQKNDWLNDAI